MPTLQCLASVIAQQIIDPTPRKKSGRPGYAVETIVLILLFKLTTGTSFELLAQVFEPSDRTLRRWYSRLTDDGAWRRLFDETLRSYDKIVGLDRSQFLTDTSKVKAYRKSEFTGKNPTDLGRCGMKLCILTDAAGVPVAVTLAAANRHDSTLLEPVLVAGCSWFLPKSALRADRGCPSKANDDLCRAFGLDPVIDQKAKKGEGPTGLSPLGDRWPIECTNTHLKRYRQIERVWSSNYDRVLGWVLLAASVVLLKRLMSWRHGWVAG